MALKYVDLTVLQPLMASHLFSFVSLVHTCFHFSLQYISVMAQNVQCTNTGPFYPTTPTNLVASGISVSDSILKDPDWLIIFILLACALLAIVIMLIILVSFSLLLITKESF